MKDISENIHKVSSELRYYENKISDFERVLANSDDESFAKYCQLKIQVGNNKPVLDGGFTNLNYSEINFKKDEVLSIIIHALEETKMKHSNLIDKLKNEIKNLDQ